MIITKKWLQGQGACLDGIDYFSEGDITDGVEWVKCLIESKRLDWANWLLVRLMTHEQKVQYAIYAAEQVIEIYESKYPTDNRPRNAIEAAKQYLVAKDKKAADAAYVAYAAAYAEVMKLKILEYGLTILDEGAVCHE